MDIVTWMEQRQSIRKYKAGEIPTEDLETILHAARVAPSWKNYQCWRYILIKERDLILDIGKNINFNPSQNTYENTTYMLAVCADPKDSGNRDEKPYYMTDVGISMQQVQLAAAELGYGTCWIGAFDEKPIKALLNIPEHIKVVALSPLGIPDEAPERKPRKSLSEIVSVDEWNKPY